MKKIIMVLGFRFEVGQTIDDVLDERPHLVKYLKKKKAFKLAGNAYLFPMDEIIEDIEKDIHAFLDRGEQVYLFSSKIDNWFGFSNKKELDKLSKIFAEK
jgi:hypothetical protein